MSGKCMCGGWRNDKGDHMSADRYVEYLQARLDQASAARNSYRIHRDQLQSRLSEAEERCKVLRNRLLAAEKRAEELYQQADLQGQRGDLLSAMLKRAEAVVEAVARLRFFENDDFGARMVRAEGDFAAVLDAIRQYEEGKSG